MQVNSENLSLLFHEVSVEIKKLKNAKIETILNNEAKFQLIVINNVESGAVGRTVKHDFGSIVSELKVLRNREEGIDLLRRRCRNKDCLKRLASFIDIPVASGCAIRQMQEKIVEAIIGNVLKSEAIQAMD